MSTETTFTQKEISQTLMDVLLEVLHQMGEPKQEITEDTKPIGGMGNFDSLCAVSATTNLSERLNMPDLDPKLFWSNVNNKPLSVKEIIERLCQLAGVGKEIVK